MVTESKRYLDEAETAQLLNVSRRMLQRWRISGDGPPYARLGVRRIGYPEGGVIAWAEARTFNHRAAEAAQRSAA
jgi:predicted DNA-binding transcriptional regulator AlpA